MTIPPPGRLYATPGGYKGLSFWLGLARWRRRIGAGRNVVRLERRAASVRKTLMEIFNIHLFEFLLIAALALVVFGPERLPEVGRFIGKQVARFLAWQQQSPELKMINEVRADFEQEIASLRDELVRTRKQLDISQEVNLNQIRDELRPMLNLREQIKEAAAPQADAATAAAQAGAPGAPQAGTPAAPQAGTPAAPQADAPAASAAPQPAPEGAAQAARPAQPTAQPTSVLGPPEEDPALRETRRRGPLDQAAFSEPPAPDAPPATNGQPAPDAQATANGPAPAAPSAEDVALLARRIESLAADLHALISGLQAQGVIGADWSPDAALSEQESLSR